MHSFGILINSCKLDLATAVVLEDPASMGVPPLT